MMKFLLACMLSMFSFFSANAQTDTLAPYQKVTGIPFFSIRLADSTLFTKNQLKPKTPTLILYFSPDCGHCQLETEELISRVKSLKNLQIVMVTSRPYEDLVDFVNHNKLNQFPTIKAGSDTKRYVTYFYDVKSTPFSAIYDKKGELIKVYKNGIDWDEMEKFAR